MKKIKKKWIIIGAVVLVLVLIVVAIARRGGKTAYTEETVAPRDVVTYYSFTGNIDAKNKQQMTATSNLSIDKIYVTQGQTVKAGDLLYSLDKSDLQSNLTAAQSSVDLAQINYDAAVKAANTSVISVPPTAPPVNTTNQTQAIASAQEALDAANKAVATAKTSLDAWTANLTAGMATQAQVDQAQTNYDNKLADQATAQKTLDELNAGLANSNSNANVNTSNATNNTSASDGTAVQTAKAQLDQANANLTNAQNAINDRDVTAKISGTVSDIYVSEKSTPKVGDPIMDVIDYNSLILSVNVDEYDISTIKLGDSVNIYVNSLDKTVSGTISSIANQAQKSGDLSYFVTEITLNQDPDLKVGLSAETRIVKDQNLNSPSISVGALQFDATNKPYVYIGDKTNPSVQYVETGANDGTVVAITSGLQNGETIYIPKNSTGSASQPTNSDAQSLRTQVNTSD